MLDTRTAIAALALAGASASAQTATMDVLSADRDMLVIACGFDYEFNDCDGGTDDTQATSGFWDRQIIADLDDYYGGDIANADGQFYSNITDTRIEIEYFADAEVVDTGIFSADAGVFCETDVEFEVLDDVRVVFSAYAESYYQAYFTASASLREVGGPLINGFGIQGGGDDDTRFTGWLYAGTYAVSADLDASAFAHVPAAGELALSFRVYHKTDYNTDGTVNSADLLAFLADYNAGDSDADYNGDGVVNSADLNTFIADWIAAS